MSVELADGFRSLDIVLGTLLFVGLCERFYVRSRPSVVSGPLGDRIAMRTAILSWLLLDVSSTGADLLRYGQPPDLTLVVRLCGHAIGVVYCAVAWSIDREKSHDPATGAPRATKG